MDPLVVIANRDAGGDQREALEQALEVLRPVADLELAETSEPGELDGVLQRAGSRTIVVAGGDGSLHAVVAALHRRNELERRPLGLIPLGTGNDYARTLEIPLDAREAAQVLIDGRTQAMDLIVDELGGIVVNNVHVGASAQASRRGARWKKRLGPLGVGILGYPIGALLAAVKPPFVRLRVEADGRTVVDLDQRVLMVAIGNGASVGGGTELTPDADPGDGELDVMVSLATGPLSRFGFAWHLKGSEHGDRDDVLALRARQVTVTGEDFFLSADGEIDGPERHRSWRLRRAAYRMIVPA